MSETFPAAAGADREPAASAASRPGTARHLPGRRADGLNQWELEREVQGGLPAQIERMRDAYDCLRYSQARFEEYPTRHKDMRYRSPAVRRTSRVFGRIMDILTMHLYRQSPTRKLKDRGVSTWLETVYKRNALGPKLKRADQFSLIGGFAALQFAGSSDPHAPLRINLWGPDQIAFWSDPEEPEKAGAVATLDYYDNRRRLRLWTPEFVCEYATEKGLNHPGFGTTSYKPVGERKPNPYRDRNGDGILPFAFAHWEFPATEFSTNSPGLNLKELNWSINERVDNLADSISFNGKPIGLARNVDPTWTPPVEIKPGDFITLPAESIDAAGNGPEPTLSYLMPDLAYVTKDWEDLNNFLDHTLEMYGVPPALIRMVQSGARSGVSLLTEQLPVMAWVEQRRLEWAAYEEDFALVALKVAESHLASHGMQAEADELQRALDDWSFLLRWPTLFVQLPGPERDTADQWRLDHNLVSMIGIAQERLDINEDEALEHFQKIAQQKQQLKALGLETNPGGIAAALGNLSAAGDGGPLADSDLEAQGPEEAQFGDADTGAAIQVDQADEI